MDATIEELAAVPVVSTTKRVRMDEIGERIGEMIPAIMQCAGPQIAGPVLARWRNFDAQSGVSDMEVAVPVRAPVATADPVVAAELPAGRAVVTWHVGPYDGLAATWEALREWMQAEGHTCRADPWEEYHSDCAVTPPDELRTKIVWPID